MCNMHCAYCFYNDVSRNRAVRNYGLMNTETSHRIIDEALKNEKDSASFAFQGGEPTLAGLDFFKDFVSYALSKAPRERLGFTIQTNGYAINREWCTFLKENDFLVGISVDGPKHIHDIYRRTIEDKGSYNPVFNNAKLLQSMGVDLNILITTTKAVAENVEEIYHLFRKNNFRFLQFIPCIDPIGEKRGSKEYSLTTETFSAFLIKLFHLYYRDWKKRDYTSIRYFDNLISLLVRGYAEECGMNGICGTYFTVEADGSVFPCDFYVMDEFLMGNINVNSLDELERKRHEIGFIEESRRIHEECAECDYFILCRGGCRRDKENFPDHTLGKSYFCTAYRIFFDTCIEKILEIANAESKAIRE